jgi:multimeric flavodoxin WrbA
MRQTKIESYDKTAITTFALPLHKQFTWVKLNMKNMKVLLVNGSPNAKGCTFMALSEVGKTLNENGIDTEIVHVGNQNLRGCIACAKCMESGKCVFDDLVNKTASKFSECDGIVVGSPVYYASANGNLISFLDRLFYSTNGFDKTMKVGAAVVSARRAGCTATFDELNKYFSISGMPIATSRYWNILYGPTPAQAIRDEEGLQTMRTLGRNMAFLIKSIALGKERFGLPSCEKPIRTNFIGGIPEDK